MCNVLQKQKSTELIVSEDNRITKSRASIHYELQPGTKLTATAAKTLYVFSYFLQVMSKKFDSAAAFNADFGTGNTEVSIPKSQLFKYTIGGSKTVCRNYQILTAVIDELKELSICWNNGKDEGQEDRGFIRVFPGIRELNGNVIFTVPARVRQLFVDDKAVAKIDWIKVNDSFSSRYPLHLNEIIEERMFESKELAASLAFTNEEIRNALKLQYTIDSSTGQKVYSNPTPASFKGKVLKGAVEQYNAAELNFTISLYEYRKSEKCWFIDIHRTKPKSLSTIGSQFPEEIIRIQTFFINIKLAKHAVDKYISLLVSEKEIRYFLYLIDVMEQSKERISTNAAGYFNGCFQKNREIFEQSWLEIQQKQRAEKDAKKLAAQKDIQEQNNKFRLQYIKLQQDNFIAAVSTGKVAAVQYLDAYLNFLRRSLLIPAFKAEYELLNSKEVVNVDSMPFRSFVTEYVQVDEAECKKYVSNQQKTLKITL